MSRLPLVVWGAGGHATVVADAVRLTGEYEIAGFLDDLHPERRGAAFGGSAILGGSEQLALLRDDGVRHLILGFGAVEARIDRAERARQAGFSFPRIVHPRAIVAAGTEIGPGTFLAAGSVLCPGVRLGEHVIVNTSASVDHGSRIEDHVHLSAGVRVGAEVEVGAGVLVGMAATVMSRVRIGARAVIGAAALVLDEVPEATIARGVPARIFARERT